MPSIRTQWLEWMQNEHISEVLATGLFLKADFYELLEPVDEEGFTFTVSYHFEQLEHYHTYINNHAPLLREKGFALFGDQFIAFRSLMQKMQPKK